LVAVLPSSSIRVWKKDGLEQAVHQPRIPEGVRIEDLTTHSDEHRPGKKPGVGT